MMAIWTTKSKHKSHLICLILVVIMFLIFRTMRTGVWEAGGLIDYFVEFVFTFTKLSDEHLGLSTCAH